MGGYCTERDRDEGRCCSSDHRKQMLVKMEMAAGSAREDCQNCLVDLHVAITSVCVDLMHACGCLQSDDAGAKELQLQGREVWRVPVSGAGGNLLPHGDASQLT